MAGNLLMMLCNALQEFADGDQFQWETLAGESDLLRRALREAINQADTYDPTQVLKECWDWLTNESAQNQVKLYFSTEPRYHGANIDTLRLHRNACTLLATAQAAIAAKQAISHHDACERLISWAKKAVTLLCGQPCESDVELTECWMDATPDKLVNDAYDAISHLGIKTQWARLWTLNWLDTSPSPIHSLRIPVAGCYSGKGFVANLHLTLLDEG